MVINDIEIDIRKMMAECKWTQRDLANAMGVTDGAVSRLLHKKTERCFDQSFLDAVDALGYDIRVEYMEKKVE